MYTSPVLYKNDQEIVALADEPIVVVPALLRLITTGEELKSYGDTEHFAIRARRKTLIDDGSQRRVVVATFAEHPSAKPNHRLSEELLNRIGSVVGRVQVNARDVVGQRYVGFRGGIYVGDGGVVAAYELQLGSFSYPINEADQSLVDTDSGSISRTKETAQLMGLRLRSLDRYLRAVGVGAFMPEYDYMANDVMQGSVVYDKDDLARLEMTLRFFAPTWQNGSGKGIIR